MSKMSDISWMLVRSDHKEREREAWEEEKSRRGGKIMIDRRKDWERRTGVKVKGEKNGREKRREEEEIEEGS